MQRPQVALVVWHETKSIPRPRQKSIVFRRRALSGLAARICWPLCTVECGHSSTPGARCIYTNASACGEYSIPIRRRCHTWSKIICHFSDQLALRVLGFRWQKKKKKGELNGWILKTEKILAKILWSVQHCRYIPLHIFLHPRGIYIVAGYRISYFITTSIYDNFILLYDNVNIYLR